MKIEIELEEDDDASYFWMLERLAKFLICLKKQTKLPCLLDPFYSPSIYVSCDGEVNFANGLEDYAKILPQIRENEDDITWVVFAKGIGYVFDSINYDDASEQCKLWYDAVKHDDFSCKELKQSDNFLAVGNFMKNLRDYHVQKS
jgi:hypothetical protein